MTPIQVLLLALITTAPPVAGMRIQEKAMKSTNKQSRGPIPMEDGTPVGVECTEEAFAQIQKWMNAGITSFDEDKEMVMRCACQNYVFTTQQAALLIGEMTWGDSQAAAVEMFRDRLSNPSQGDAILAVIKEEKEKVAEMLNSFKPAETRKMAEYPMEDHGVRADEDVNRFAETFSKAAFDDDRLQVVKDEMKTKPAPPFSAAQLIQVLEKIKFSDEAVILLQELAAPGAIYPLACTEIAQVLGKYLMQDDKLKMLAAMKPLIKDPQNKPMLVSVFEFPDDKAKAEKILRDVVVDFKPFVPPEAQIQQAIKNAGACPSGYLWRKVQGGYRCAAGGHFLSDEQIQKELNKLNK